MTKQTAHPFVTTLTQSQAKKLQQALVTQGFQLSQPPYTIFSAKKPNLSCTLYTSLKLTVQGKGMREFIEFYLEPEILKNTIYTHAEHVVDKTGRIGVDEAGKGDFFGPLCIASVYAEGDTISELVRLKVGDSKTIPDNTIHILAAKIKTLCPHHVIRLYPLKYNELYGKFHNLNSLLAWCHATAIEQLATRHDCKKAIIDQFGHESLARNAVLKKGIDIELIQRHKAEEDVVVAAASILARAAFLEGLQVLSQEVEKELPKGAAPVVIQVGKMLVKIWGEDVLSKVCKLHFRTTGQVLGN